MKIVLTSYLAGAAILVYFKIKYLTALTLVSVVIISGLKLSAWLKHRKEYKGSKCIVYCRALLSVLVYIELMLVSFKADKIIELGILPLMAIIWALLPFCIASCIATLVLLIARISVACKREREKTMLVSIPFFLWLLVVFCGGPILIYITVYNLSIQGHDYVCTPRLSSLFLSKTAYSMATLVFHLLISSSFR